MRSIMDIAGRICTASPRRKPRTSPTPGLRLGLAVLAALLFVTFPAVAHEVPKNTHDRTIVVRLAEGGQPHAVKLRVDYRLEVNEYTVLFNDLEAYDLSRDDFIGKHEQMYNELARRMAPVLAFRLSPKLNGKRIELQPIDQKATTHDENRTPLGHLRVDFVFEASFEPATDKQNELFFRDGSYEQEEGKIDVSLVNEAGLTILHRTAPDEALKKRSLHEPGDDDRLRELRVVLSGERGDAPETAPAAKPQAPGNHDDAVLLRLLFQSGYGFWLTMLMAAVFGAAHALTPGHGKTLVAAYLVGERGTAWHAVVLGIVTTLTHTGVVLLIAVVLFLLPRESQDSFGRWIQNGLGLLMGLIVVCMGFWLLLQRLSGRADHFHVGGSHHHHHGPSEPPASAGGEVPSVRWWGLIVLGITGGLVPCWDAIYVLLYTVGRSQFLLALPAVIAFSAGLAGVLVLIGVLVVQVPNFARSRWGHGVITRALPIASAVVVTLMGLWLCYEGVHGQ
jgi:ABC-type nickel/cobalt efflux system permease component RcnA